MTYQVSFNHDLACSSHSHHHLLRQLPLVVMDRKAKAKGSQRASRIPGNPRARSNGSRRFNGMVVSSNSACDIRWASVRLPTVAFSICVRTQLMEKLVAKTMGRCPILPPRTDSPKGIVTQVSPCMIHSMRLTPWRLSQCMKWTQFKTLLHLVIVLPGAVCPNPSRRMRKQISLPPSPSQRNPWFPLRQFHQPFQLQF